MTRPRPRRWRAASSGWSPSGHPAAEIAVLFRTNGQSQAFESALAAVEVPYLVRGGERFFARKEVRDAILLLRGAGRSDDGAKPLGRDHPRRHHRRRAGRPRRRPVGEPRESAGSRWPPSRPWRTTSRQRRRRPGCAELVAELDRRAAEQHAPPVQGVTLASLHAAKGLEWDSVFVVGASDGLIPISLADGLEAVEEERRLLYVGLTRARRQLFLSWSLARSPGDGRAGASRASWPRPRASWAAVQGRRRRQGAAAHRSEGRPRRSRAECAAPTSSRPPSARPVAAPTARPSYDEAVFERLRSWRLAVARANGVPAFVVFTDATLTAIAERMPVDRSALAAISGVGARKIDQYARTSLAVLSGADPQELLEKHSAATESADL